MKLLYISLCSLLACISSFGQNYQTFYPDDVHYFREYDKGHMLASQFDSSETIDDNLTLYPFKSLRESPPGSILLVSDSWMGNKIVIEPDGTNLFFNQNGDTIRLETQASVGETFIVYTYETEETVAALVTSITEETVLGTVDSVKTFELASTHPDFDLSHSELKIGKTTGLLTIYPFYSFPEKYQLLRRFESGYSDYYELVGQLYPTTGLTIPTKAEINDVEVDDVIQYLEWNGEYGPEETFRKTVISKTDVGLDSVAYEFGINSQYFYPGTSEIDPSYTTDTMYTESDTFSISNEPINLYHIPEKDYGEGETDMTIVLKYDYDCGYELMRYTEGTRKETDCDTCPLAYQLDPTIRTWSHYSSALNFGYYDYKNYDGGSVFTHGRNFQTRLVDGEVCGNGNFLSIEDPDNQIDFALFPNPAIDQLFLEIDQPVDFVIYDALGKEVLSGRTGDNLSAIDISNLTKGLYLVNLITENQTISSTRFIKQ